MTGQSAEELSASKLRSSITVNDAAGDGIEEVNGVSVTETILRHVVENQKIQAEAMANTPIDFETSPTIVAELEDGIDDSGIGHSQSIEALLQMTNLAPLVTVLIGMGLYEKTREEAERTANAG